MAVSCVLAMSLVLFTAVPASAQLGDLLNLLFPSPAAPPPPEEEAPPPAPAPAPAPAPDPAQAPAAAAGVDRSQPFPLALPQIRRSPARNTNTLIANLQPAVDRGVPLETAILQVVAPFPVAGKANFSHDWGFPRWTPTPHLHKGTDIFAAFGTPIVTSEAGRVIRMGAAGAGGLSVWVRGDSGMAYYYAHLQNWAKGLSVDQRVERGEVIGFVGDTGNARGGAPHLHFELHPGGAPGTPARDPKPFLDDALRQAEAQAAAFQGVGPGIPNSAGGTLLPGIIVTKEIDKLLQASAMQGPADVMWFSMMDPTLGVLGLARQGAAAGSTRPPEPTDAETLEAQRLDDVRRAVGARTENVTKLVANSQAKSAVVMGPLRQALVPMADDVDLEAGAGD